MCETPVTHRLVNKRPLGLVYIKNKASPQIKSIFLYKTYLFTVFAQIIVIAHGAFVADSSYVFFTTITKDVWVNSHGFFVSKQIRQ